MPSLDTTNLHAISDVDLVKILFRINKVNNDTFQATVIENPQSGVYNDTQSQNTEAGALYMNGKDDPQGALYYVVVVLSVYAFAIVMFIASFVKKSGQDHGISIYMRDLEKVKRMERRQEKFRFKLQMVHKDKKHRILGDDRALVESRRGSDTDAVEEQHLLLKPESDTSMWSLVSFNVDDTCQRALGSSSAPPSPGILPHSPLTLGPTSSCPPSPSGIGTPTPVLTRKDNKSTAININTNSNGGNIGPIPKVTIETCE